ncbi:MAG: FAD:protein FMN transferase [Ginsengibacter sp.]
MRKTAKQLIRLINYKNVLLDKTDTTVFLKEKGIRIGFGGIGKGYAAEKSKYLLNAYKKIKLIKMEVCKSKFLYFFLSKLFPVLHSRCFNFLLLLFIVLQAPQLKCRRKMLLACVLSNACCFSTPL